MTRKRLYFLGLAVCLAVTQFSFSNGATEMKMATQNIGTVDYKADYQDSITLQVGKDSIPFSYPSTYHYKDDLWEGTLQAKTVTLTPENSSQETRYKTQSKTEQIQGRETANDDSFPQNIQYHDGDGWRGTLSRMSVKWKQNGYGSQRQMTEYERGPFMRTGHGLSNSINRNYNGNDCTLYLQSYRSVNSAKQYDYSVCDGSVYNNALVNYTTLGWMSNNGSTFSSNNLPFANSLQSYYHLSWIWPDTYYGDDNGFKGGGWDVWEYYWADSQAYNADTVASWGQAYRNKLFYENGGWWWRSESGKPNKYRKGTYIKYRKAFDMFQYEGTYVGSYYPKLYDGFAEYSGTVSRKQQIATKWNATVHYAGTVESRPQVTVETDGEYTYHTDTDVITTVTMKTDKDITSDEPVIADFSIMGQTYRVENVVVPSADRQLVYVKWHTPKEPQANVPVTVKIKGGARPYEQTFYINIVDLPENIPPNPTAEDDKKPAGWTLSPIPEMKGKEVVEWVEWQHNSTEGFTKAEYFVKLTGNLELTPDLKVPTANAGIMGSGYGVNMTVSTQLTGNGDTKSVTGAQNVNALFPEYGYQNYNRLLQMKQSGIKAVFQLKENLFSTYGSRVHFTPLWYPDGSYPVSVEILDAWTPAGKLSVQVTDKIEIKGSVYDDWHIGAR